MLNLGHGVPPETDPGVLTRIVEFVHAQADVAASPNAACPAPSNRRDRASVHDAARRHLQPVERPPDAATGESATGMSRTRGFASGRGDGRGWNHERSLGAPIPRARRSATPCGPCSAAIPRDPRPPATSADAVSAVESTGVTVRGFYDVSGLRADADLMVWLHGDDPEVLQSALRTLRRAEPLASLLPVWNAMGVHRDAEFTASHLPAFMRGKEPEAWLTVYPFVRSYEWYMLPDDERRQMLADHGRKGSRVPPGAEQHRRLVRARRLRVDPRPRGARARRPRRPHARTSARPRPDATCAKRSRSTPAAASASTRSPRCWRDHGGAA